MTQTIEMGSNVAEADMVSLACSRSLQVEAKISSST